MQLTVDEVRDIMETPEGRQVLTTIVATALGWPSPSERHKYATPMMVPAYAELLEGDGRYWDTCGQMIEKLTQWARKKHGEQATLHLSHRYVSQYGDDKTWEAWLIPNDAAYDEPAEPWIWQIQSPRLIDTLILAFAASGELRAEEIPR